MHEFVLAEQTGFPAMFAQSLFTWHWTHLSMLTTYIGVAVAHAVHEPVAEHIGIPETDAQSLSHKH